MLFGSVSLAFLEKLLQILRASESRCQAWTNYSVLDCNFKVIKQVSTEQLISVKKEVIPSGNMCLHFHVRSEGIVAPVTRIKPVGAQMGCGRCVSSYMLSQSAGS